MLHEALTKTQVPEIMFTLLHKYSKSIQSVSKSLMPLKLIFTILLGEKKTGDEAGTF